MPGLSLFGGTPVSQPSGGLGGFNPNDLLSYINSTLSPLFNQLQTNQGPINAAFQSYIQDPNAGMDALRTAVGGEANQLFMPGGQISKAVKGARGDAISKGWNPSDAFGAESGIFQQGTNFLESELSKGALGLKQQQQGAISGAYGQGWENLFGGAESIFGAGSNVFGLNLAKQQQDLMNRGIFSFFGNG